VQLIPIKILYFQEGVSSQIKPQETKWYSFIYCNFLFKNQVLPHRFFLHKLKVRII